MVVSFSRAPALRFVYRFLRAARSLNGNALRRFISSTASVFWEFLRVLGSWPELGEFRSEEAADEGFASTIDDRNWKFGYGSIPLFEKESSRDSLVFSSDCWENFLEKGWLRFSLGISKKGTVRVKRLALRESLFMWGQRSI